MAGEKEPLKNKEPMSKIRLPIRENDEIEAIWKGKRKHRKTNNKPPGRPRKKSRLLMDSGAKTIPPDGPAVWDNNSKIDYLDNPEQKEIDVYNQTEYILSYTITKSFGYICLNKQTPSYLKRIVQRVIDVYIPEDDDECICGNFEYTKDVANRYLYALNPTITFCILKKNTSTRYKRLDEIEVDVWKTFGPSWKVFYNHRDAPLRNYFYVRKYGSLYYFHARNFIDMEEDKYEEKIKHIYEQYSEERKSLVEDALHRNKSKKPYNPNHIHAFCHDVINNTLLLNVHTYDEESKMITTKKGVQVHELDWIDFMKNDDDFEEIYTRYGVHLFKTWRDSLAEKLSNFLTCKIII